MILARIAKLIGETDKYRWGFRVTLGLVVFGSMVWGATANFSHEVQAPLFALIAATAWAGTLGARTARRRETTLKWLLRMAAIGASGNSAYQWLLSAEAGPGIQLWGAVLAAFAVAALWVNAKDIDATIAKQNRSDGGDSVAGSTVA